MEVGSALGFERKIYEPPWLSKKPGSDDIYPNAQNLSKSVSWCGTSMNLMWDSHVDMGREAKR